MEKKEYAKPLLTVHGDIEKITMLSGLVNADLPNGTPNTAFCPAGTVQQGNQCVPTTLS